jgi:hypothetical protein
MFMTTSIERTRMNFQEYQQTLMDMYQGEVLGEALFSRLLETETHPEMRYAYSCLLQLETETKARLRSILVRHGLPISESESNRAEGASWANSLRTLDKQVFLNKFTEEIAPYAERYSDFAQQAAAEDAECLQYVAKHEQAIHHFLIGLKTRSPRESISAARDLLRFPLYETPLPP